MTATAALDKAIREGLETAIPEGSLTISQWAERYRYVSPQRSVRPGRWDNSIVPFARGIMDAVTEPDVRKVVLMKSSQVAGTEIIINVLCYYIHVDPSLMLYIAEIEDKARAWTNEAFDPTIAESPALRRCMWTDVSGKSADNNQRIKRFKGGQLTIGWASSPAQLSSRPARIICFDEVDAFQPTAEGDAVKLAEARTKTCSGQEKIILVSSPRKAETSIIEREYNNSDRNEFYLPCLHCNEFQTLKWANVRWDDRDAENAYYVCEACGVLIEHEEKAEMLERGCWIREAERRDTAGFKINELYSPFGERNVWGSMAVDFLESKKHYDTLQVWTNTRMGQTWKAEERIEYGDLQLNREEYKAPVPDGVLMLTAGVDVQGDRLEVEVVGWGRDRESWSIDYRVLMGDPSRPQIWDELTDYLTDEWEGEIGDFRIAAVGVDTGGHHTQEVYKFCHRNKGRNWFALKGSSEASKPLVSKPSLVGRNPKVRLYTIGTNAAKDEIFAFLRTPIPGPGYCHFPANDKYDDAYLKQLCSEKKVPRYRSGREVHVYEKVSASARNEALDVRVYATAARAIMNPNWRKLSARIYGRDEEEAVQGAKLEAPSEEQPEEIVPETKTPEPDKNIVKVARPRGRRGRVRVANNPFKGFRA